MKKSFYMNLSVFKCGEAENESQLHHQSFFDITRFSTATPSGCDGQMFLRLFQSDQ